MVLLKILAQPRHLIVFSVLLFLKLNCSPCVNYEIFHYSLYFTFSLQIYCWVFQKLKLIRPCAPRIWISHSFTSFLVCFEAFLVTPELAGRLMRKTLDSSKKTERALSIIQWLRWNEFHGFLGTHQFLISGFRNPPILK